MSWFYAKHGKQEGPVDQAELRSKLTSGELSPDDLVWREGMAEWTPAGKIAELAPGEGSAAAVPEAGTPGATPGSEAGSRSDGAAPQPAISTAPTGSPAGPAQVGGLAMQSQPAPGMPMLAPPPPTSGLAIASMVCGIISLMSCYVWALVGIPAVICGHMALKAINKSPNAVEGRGMAMAGLITGYLAILIQIAAIVLLVVLISSGSFQ